MKNLSLIYVGVFSIWLSGCGSEMANSSTNAPPRTPVTTNAKPANNVADSKTPNFKPANSTANLPTKGVNTNSTGNSEKSTPKPAATATPAAEKKDDGLFSFPPPKVTDVSEVKPSDLGAGENTTLLQVSEKLTDGLEKAGYKQNKYSFFWNDRDEFAIVTAMERVNADGSNFKEDRWVEDKNLPSANGFKEYFRYLIEGKKVFYRVFAFVVTARRSRQSFKNIGSPPEFVTALNWKNKGEPNLGDGETTTIESAVFTPKHKCFVLLYLFVNHTSLDLPKSVDSLNDNEKRLQEELVKEADMHINNTNLHFGG